MANAKIAVLGHGAWGTAIATVLTHAGHRVKLWCPEAEDVASIRVDRINQHYMPYFRLPDAIWPTAHVQEAIVDSTHLFIAIPVVFFRSVIQQAQPYTVSGQTWISLSKGIEVKTGLLPTDIIKQELPSVSLAVLSGPSYACQVMAQEPTGVVVAASCRDAAQRICELLSTSWFTAYPSTDMIGVQWCGAGKNIIALAVGIMKGAGYGDNTQALALTAGWCEIDRLARHFGGQGETLLGLAGLGDLCLTTFGKESRNKSLGMALAEAKTLDAIVAHAGYKNKPEGLNTLKSMYAIIAESAYDAPFIIALYRYVYEPSITVRELIDAALCSLVNRKDSA